MSSYIILAFNKKVAPMKIYITLSNNNRIFKYKDFG